jgi:hypothetical protein
MRGEQAMKRLLALCGVVLLSAAAMGQAPINIPMALQPSEAAIKSLEVELNELRASVTAQQKQLEAQKKQIETLTGQFAAQQAENVLRQNQAVSRLDELGMVASSTAMPVVHEREPAEAPSAQSVPQTDRPPKASDSIVLAQGKIKLGATAYADWSIYPQTGFGPAFLDTPHTYPGPANDGYNGFNLNRTYINMLFSPTDWVTFRITPDIYRDVIGGPGQALSGTSGIGATPNGSLNFRLKYGYAEFTKLFGGAAKEDNLRFGQQTNPLIDWEEGLWGYRFVSLVPWNFISLSSTYTGVSLNGPIKGSNGQQYLDYQVGVFNNSNFHQYELGETKTVMARASLYPFGASSKYEGLGMTGFIDYGYNNAAPDTNSKTPVVRTAAILSYQSPHNGAHIAFEYDFGRNAFSTGNLFGGSSPPDLVGLGTTSYAGMSNLAKAVLAGRSVKQQGYDVFGHISLGTSKWALFSLYQFFQPNTNVPGNPFDFHRVVVGISYTANKNVRIALDSQNVLYSHDQFTYPASALASFSSSLAAANPGGIPNAVPPSVKAVFVNMEFTF